MAFWDKILFGIKKDKITDKRDFYVSLSNNRKNIVQGEKLNCFGTALYLVGAKDKDKYSFPDDTDFFKKSIQSKNPGVGYVVGWIDNSKNIYHVAVITGINPLTVSTRNGLGRPFLPKEKFDDVDKFYRNVSDFKEIKYFIPSKLQKILDMGAQN